MDPLNIKDNPFFLLSLVLVVLAVAAGVTIAVAVKISNKHYNHVQAESQKLQSVKKLNGQYSFSRIDLPALCRQRKSKRDFDQTDLKKYLFTCIVDAPDTYQKMIERAEQNAENYDSYKNAFRTIMRNESVEEKTLYEKYKYFKKLETSVCYELLKKPCCSVSIRVEKRYTSQKGRNSYYDYRVFSHSTVKNCYQEAIKSIKTRSNVQYERQLMTDSLRYDIMKRDGFRCVLCGARQADGVRLEVDHIKPVSKGGKTVPSNLRTLCDRCNRGKAAKYDANGLN